MQAMQYHISHTYNYNTTTVRTISVNASNLVSTAKVSMDYLLDVPISNLTFSCLSKEQFIYINNSLTFRITGNWGNYLELVISRQDGVAMLNRTFTSYKPSYQFNLTFWVPNLWTLTLTASNYVGQVKNTLPKPVMAIEFIAAGCNVPYVDIVIPNACVPKKSCDPQYPLLNAMIQTRSSSLLVRSNTTNFCPRPVSCLIDDFLPKALISIF